MEKPTLSWRRAASPGKRHLGVLPRGALRVLQGSAAIGSDDVRPGEIRASPTRAASRSSRRVASRRVQGDPGGARAVPRLLAFSPWFRWCSPTLQSRSLVTRYGRDGSIASPNRAVEALSRSSSREYRCTRRSCARDPNDSDASDSSDPRHDRRTGDSSRRWRATHARGRLARAAIDREGRG